MKAAKIREMGDRDLYGGGQVLEAIRLVGPRRVIGEDVADPGFLGTGEHGAGYGSRTRRGGPATTKLLAESLGDLHKIGNLRSAYSPRSGSGHALRGRSSQAGPRWSTSGTGPFGEGAVPRIIPPDYTVARWHCDA